MMALSVFVELGLSGEGLTPASFGDTAIIMSAMVDVSSFIRARQLIAPSGKNVILLRSND